MSRISFDPRTRIDPKQPTDRSILVTWAMALAIPLSLWVVSNPLVGTLALAGSVALSTGTRRALALARCLEECGGFAFALGDVRIAVTRPDCNDVP